MRGGARTKLTAILQIVDNATEPSLMSLEEAKEFVEELISDLESRLDGIKDDIRTTERG